MIERGNGNSTHIVNLLCNLQSIDLMGDSDIMGNIAKSKHHLAADKMAGRKRNRNLETGYFIIWENNATARVKIQAFNLFRFFHFLRKQTEEEISHFLSFFF